MAEVDSSADAQRRGAARAPALGGAARHDEQGIRSRHDVEQQAGNDEQRQVVDAEHGVPL
jgi:hypothetical protein